MLNGAPSHAIPVPPNGAPHHRAMSAGWAASPPHHQVRCLMLTAMRYRLLTESCAPGFAPSPHTATASVLSQLLALLLRRAAYGHGRSGLSAFERRRRPLLHADA